MSAFGPAHMHNRTLVHTVQDAAGQLLHQSAPCCNSTCKLGATQSLHARLVDVLGTCQSLAQPAAKQASAFCSALATGHFIAKADEQGLQLCHKTFSAALVLHVYCVLLMASFCCRPGCCNCVALQCPPVQLVVILLLPCHSVGPRPPAVSVGPVSARRPSHDSACQHYQRSRAH